MRAMAMPPFPWQRDSWNTVCDMVTNDRLPHALLITGVQGGGIEDFAAQLARYLLCHTPLEDVACGRCKGCKLFEAGSHPDFFLLTREGDEQKRSEQIKIDQVRECVEFVEKTPHFDFRKAVLIDEADRLNTSAANALLKSLEEPQGNTVFLLVTTRLHGLLATIRSRCQHLQLSLPSFPEGLEWLNRQDIKQAEHLLKLANGAPLTAKNWSDTHFDTDYLKVSDTLENLLSGTEGVISACAKLKSIEFTRMLRIQTLLLDQVIKSCFDATPGSTPFFEPLAQINSRYLFKLRDSIDAKMDEALSFSNLNQELLVEELTLDWFALTKLMTRSGLHV